VAESEKIVQTSDLGSKTYSSRPDGNSSNARIGRRNS
jgi:hypothetical protein